MISQRDQFDGAVASDSAQSGRADGEDTQQVTQAAGGPACLDAKDGEGSRRGGCASEEQDIPAQNDLFIAYDQAIADLRARSRVGKLTTPARWRKLGVAPVGVDAADFAERLLSFIEGRPHATDEPAMGDQVLPLGYDDRPELDGLELDEPLPAPEVDDIVIMYGKGGAYLYSKPLMSHSYAHALFNTAEHDDLATFADVVRTESRVYPRPIAASDFLNPPYLWSAAKVADLYERAGESEAYADIELTSTSLNQSYFYSTKYLSPAQGKALAEWHGVERRRNP